MSNIILNSIWYDALFPLPEDVTDQIGAADILDPRGMSGVECRSLDGLVAFCLLYPLSLGATGSVTALRASPQPLLLVAELLKQGILRFRSRGTGCQTPTAHRLQGFPKFDDPR